MAAPRTRPSKLQDVVEVVVKKLDDSVRKDIDRDIIIKTQEALRFLNLKAPIAQKRLSTYDSPEVRAAILLEYVAREEKNVRLDMGTIAKKLGIKNKKNLQILHGIIGNYRRTDVAQAIGVASRAAVSGSTSVRQTRHSAPPPTSTIPRLAIRLSSLVQDPNGLAIKAEQLFQDMIEYVETLPHKRKQDYKQEIQQYRSAYEASCFYHVVSKTQTKKLLRGSSQHQRQQQLQYQRDSNIEDERNRGLELDDILDASPDFSHMVLKQVLEHLGEMMEGIELAKTNKTKAASKCSKRVDKATTNKKAKGEHARAKRGSTTRDKGMAGPPKRPRSTIDSEAGLQTEDEKENVVVGEEDSNRDDDHVDDAIVEPLREWRERVLNEACHSAKEALHEERGTSMEDIADSEALAFAAREVLSRFKVGIIA